MEKTEGGQKIEIQVLKYNISVGYSGTIKEIPGRGLSSQVQTESRMTNVVHQIPEVLGQLLTIGWLSIPHFDILRIGVLTRLFLPP